MEIYLLKSAACLAIFLAFYKLFMENTSIHNFKRFYLLGSLLAAFGIPLIIFTTYVAASGNVPIVIFTEGLGQSGNIEETTNFLAIALWSTYVLGVLFFTVKFCRNLYIMFQKINRNPTQKSNGIFHVLLKTATTPHTFFNYVFLNKYKFEHHEIPETVLLHEYTHAKEKHSIDVLLLEILQIVFWFNPLLYFIKQSVKLNHEFLADRAVLNAGAETSNYQNTLLTYAVPQFSTAIGMANAINYSSLKKRFTLMKTQTPKRSIWLRSLLLLPLLSILLFSFSNKEIVEMRKNDAVYSEPLQDKATKKEVAEYNKLAKKYNDVDINERIIKKKDLERLEIIYKKMNDAQKSKAEPFPECIPPPPPPKLGATTPNTLGNDIFYYQDRVITEATAVKLLKENSALNIYVSKSEKGKNIATLSETPIKNSKVLIPPPPPPPAPKAPSAENGYLYTVPIPPPPPNTDLVKYIKELAEKGATFYIGPHKYSADKAIEMVQKSKDATIDVSDYPIVRLGGC